MTISRKTCQQLPGSGHLKAMYGDSHLMHTTAPERGVTVVTILEMKPPRHGDSKHVIQRHKASE